MKTWAILTAMLLVALTTVPAKAGDNNTHTVRWSNLTESDGRYCQSANGGTMCISKASVISVTKDGSDYLLTMKTDRVNGSSSDTTLASSSTSSGYDCSKPNANPFSDFWKYCSPNKPLQSGGYQVTRDGRWVSVAPPDKNKTLKLTTE